MPYGGDSIPSPISSSRNPLKPEGLHQNVYQRGLFDNDRSVQSPESCSNRQLIDPSHQSGRYPTDELCPRATLRLILNDYLDLVYLLIPVVHIPTFVSQLQSNRDIHDKDFSCLLLCLCALTVSLLRNRFDKYCHGLDPSSPGLRFSSRTETINTCYDICMRQRRPSYFDEVNHAKWAAAYLMQIAMFQIGNHNMSRMLEVEAMQLARLLGLHRIADYAGLNIVEVQLRRKAFWLMFYVYVYALSENFLFYILRKAAC